MCCCGAKAMIVCVVVEPGLRLHVSNADLALGDV